MRQLATFQPRENMNTAELQSKMSTHSEQDSYQYRSVSKSAVACLVFAVLSVFLSFVSEVFVLFPMLGVIFGLCSIAAFRKFPGELVGKAVAKVGLALSLLCLVTSLGYHGYIYATEVPPDHERISFRDLAPKKKRSKHPFSEKALELDGQKVFLKGYVRPSDKQRGLKNFILVGDFGDCCFGGNPKITEVVAISIVSDDTVDYSLRKRKVSGEFRLHQKRRAISEEDIPSVYYEIIANHVQ